MGGPAGLRGLFRVVLFAGAIGLALVPRGQLHDVTPDVVRGRLRGYGTGYGTLVFLLTH